MRAMPRILLLLFFMSMMTMMFIARCGLNMDTYHESQHSGLPSSSAWAADGRSPSERALREVMRRKEVEHIRDKSVLQEKIKTLESKLSKVQTQVVNLTASLQSTNTGQKRQSRGERDAGELPLPGGADGRPRYASDARYAYDGQVAGDRRYPNGFPGNGMYYRDGSHGRVKNVMQAVNGNENYYVHTGSQNARANYADGDPRAYEKRGLGVPVKAMNKPEYLGYNRQDGYGAQFEQGKNVREGFDDRRALDGVNDFRNFPFGDDVGELEAGQRSLVDRRALGVQGDDDGRFGDGWIDADAVAKDGTQLDKAGDGGNPQFNAAFRLNSENYLGSNQGKYGTIRADTGKPAFDYDKYILERLNKSEVLRGQSYKTEYELIPFNRFTFNRIFLVDPGLGKRVVEKPIGSKKKDLNEVMFHAVQTLNKNRTKDQVIYTHNDFVEGVYRTDPTSGTQYELYFLNKDESNVKHKHSYVKVNVVRPFAPPLTVQNQLVDTSSQIINIILPLSGRVDTFRMFIDQFIHVCIKFDKRIYLTVVYFGTEGLKEIRTIMGNVAKTHKYKHMKLVTLNETFARGRGLQIGALNWKGGDVILFFCDVDIVFTPEFLERCRLNTEPGQRVYYPIVFSLYNPRVVYSMQDIPIPNLQEQLILSKDTGFWRDFGYGMTCQYRSDFLKLKGFDEKITGWGGEDVFLYQKFVRSDYFVVRATDPAIFHLWHEKFCDPTLSAEQYRSCIRSKALNEASHPQLGLLAFKDEVDVHRSVSEKNILASIANRNSENKTVQNHA